MDDVYLSFKDTGREGAMAAGNYILDAAHQLGVKLECDCDSEEPKNTCAVRINKGSAFLSKPTELEKERLSVADRKGRQRLACQVLIERPGEIDVTVVAEPEAEKKEVKETEEEFKEKFSTMPLDEKIKHLVQLEAIALSETVSYIMNSPYEAVGGVMTYLAGFGRQMDDADRDSKIPEDHKSANGEAGADVEDEIPATENDAEAS